VVTLLAVVILQTMVESPMSASPRDHKASKSMIVSRVYFNARFHSLTDFIYSVDQQEAFGVRCLFILETISFIWYCSAPSVFIVVVF
jgi:hypothetical protein